MWIRGKKSKHFFKALRTFIFLHWEKKKKQRKHTRVLQIIDYKNSRKDKYGYYPK